MNCEEALLAISAALDGELSPQERMKLSRHLLECPDCRELAEDLRVLTDALEESDREPPAELAESVRRAVAEEAGLAASAPTPRKKHTPPYLRAAAAMLALCMGLGGVGLVVYGGLHSGKSADSGAGAAPALYQSAPEEAEENCVGYTGWGENRLGGSGPTSDAETDGAAPEAPAAPEGAPERRDGGLVGSAPESDGDPVPAPREQLSVGYRGTEDGEETDSAAGVTAANGGEETFTPESALELVFQHLGGYETYPEAERVTGSVAYCLKSVETGAVHSDYYLVCTGLYSDGRSYWFRLYEDVAEKGEKSVPDHEASLNWFIVSPEREITAEFPELSVY